MFLIYKTMASNEAISCETFWGASQLASSPPGGDYFLGKGANSRCIPNVYACVDRV